MTSLVKPAKGTAKKARRSRRSTKQLMYADARRQCFARDKGRCRACYTNGLTLDFHGDPFSVFQAHHVVYRSRGGKDTVGNLLGACVRCHQLFHLKRLSVTGDPNTTVVFREYDPNTRELLRKWESTV